MFTTYLDGGRSRICSRERERERGGGSEFQKTFGLTFPPNFCVEQCAFPNAPRTL